MHRCTSHCLSWQLARLSHSCTTLPYRWINRRSAGWRRMSCPVALCTCSRSRSSIPDVGSPPSAPSRTSSLASWVRPLLREGLADRLRLLCTHAAWLEMSGRALKSSTHESHPGDHERGGDRPDEDEQCIRICAVARNILAVICFIPAHTPCRSVLLTHRSSPLP